jgi:outer membrane protein OmpA-like peptidoglycan-associated protein
MTATAESTKADISATARGQAAVPPAKPDSGLPVGTPSEAVTGASAPIPHRKAEAPRLASDVPGTGIEAGLRAFLAVEKAPTAREAWFDLDRPRFDAGKTSPRQASEAQLRPIAEILSAYPNARIIVGGHTDSRGDARKNRQISELRAKYVLRELTRMGVDSSRLEARGYGADRPIAPNSTAEGRARNRRVSLVVIRR